MSKTQTISHSDEWVSTLHRVQVPSFEGTVDTSSSQNGESNRRQSIAFFVGVNGDTVVTPIETCVSEKNPPKYGEITARKHLLTKYLISQGETTDHL